MWADSPPHLSKQTDLHRPSTGALGSPWSARSPHGDRPYVAPLGRDLGGAVCCTVGQRGIWCAGCGRRGPPHPRLHLGTDQPAQWCSRVYTRLDCLAGGQMITPWQLPPLPCIRWISP